MEDLTRQVTLLETQQKDLVRKEQIILQVNRFVNDVTRLGFEPKKWGVYEVNLEEKMTFAETEQVLNQCTSSGYAYFKPVLLHLKKTSAVDSPASPDGELPGDLRVTLRGKFLARQN